jgi:hypothetical protein
MGSNSLRERRARWTRLAATAPPPGALRITLLASYTIDPLMPYLGLRLIDGGLPATLAVGPFNQIVQQCLDDAGVVAVERPDVLVVAPRLEEVPAADLPALADAAAAAARRWGCCLVFVIPAPPRPTGIGDAGDTSGAVASGTAAREAVRARLAGLANVLLADAEEAVREVGGRHAHQPSLFRFAKIPYAEEVFATLGERVGRLLLARYGAAPAAVVVDVDSVPVDLVPSHGVRLALVGGRDHPPPPIGEVAAWVFDERPAADRVADLAARLRLPRSALAVVTADPDLPDADVVLGPDTDRWPDELEEAGVLDLLPDPWAVPARPSAAVPASGGLPTLAEFVAGLGVTVEPRPAADDLAEVTELVARAKDFTLGDPPTPGALDAGVIAFRVADRLGDYGLSAAVRLATDGPVCTVDVFAISCPVLGKGVPDLILAEIVERAAAAGCETIRFPHHDTGENRAAAEFLATIGDRPASALRLLVEAIPA